MRPGSGRRKCRLCETEMLFAENVETGKVVPLDTEAPAFIAYRDNRGKVMCRPFKKWAWDLIQAVGKYGTEPERLESLVMGVESAYVSHFSTCPEAEAFRRKKPADKPAGGGS